MPDSRIPAQFATTHWSLVLNAAGEESEASAALESLCKNYWWPLYGYVRRRVSDEHEAQDLTQAFFEQLLAKNFLAAADPTRGRFRSFLLTAIKNFLSNEWAKAQTIKRGGDRKIFSVDFSAADSRLGIPLPVHLTPDQIFERQWAITLLDRVLDQLQYEWSRTGKRREFEILKPFLLGSNQQSYADAVGSLEISESAARMAVSRLRKAYRRILREEIAQTVDKPQDVEDELRKLFTILANG